MVDLNERSRRILHAVVVEFVDTGQPVGSKTITEKRCADLSPATIRNVMSDLEEQGLLYQPHTSAGRVPTDSGFRFFIDSLMSVGPLAGKDADLLQSLDSLPPNLLAKESGRILSQLAGLASVVVTSRIESRVLAQIRFVPARETNSLLAVIMFRDGGVETRFVASPELPADSELERIHNMLEEHTKGKSLQELRELFARQLADHRLEIDEVERKACELGLRATEPSAAEEPDLVIQGEALLLEQPDFNDAQPLKHLMRALGDRERLLGLLDGTISARAVQVLVGREAGGLGDGSLSFVVAPFTEAGSPVGTVGVFGPTRMDYERMIPLVSATATALSAAHDRAVGVSGSRLLKRPRRRTR